MPNLIPKLGKAAPEIDVSEWVQGAPTSIAQERGNVVLIEVFQVNCPGCFLYAIPEAISVHNRFANDGVRVLGIATAFEDFEKNTLENLRLLAEKGEVIGETQKALSAQSQLLDGGRIPYPIPFPLGMDRLTKSDGEFDDAQAQAIIRQQVPNFQNQPVEIQNRILQQIRDYLTAKVFTAATFERYSLRGTPSTILVDRDGKLRDVSFGQTDYLIRKIENLLKC